MKTVFALLTGFVASQTVSISKDQMYSCISDNLPTADWEQMIGNFNNHESRQLWSGNVADAALKCYDNLEGLPNVCAGGKSCRADIRSNLRTQVVDVWVKVFDQIAQSIANRKTNVATKVSQFYQRAYDCAPGCSCDNVGVTYDSWIDRQHRVWKDVTDLNQQRCKLWCQAGVYHGTCPHFESLPDYDWTRKCDCENAGSTGSTDDTEFTRSESTTTSSSSTSRNATYFVNGVEMTQEEYDDYLASQGSSSSTSETTYTVNGQEMTEEEYNAYMDSFNKEQTQPVDDVALPF